jgi:hypothetical protein
MRQNRLPDRILIQFPREGELMANLAGIVQQLRKERDQAARTLERLDRGARRAQRRFIREKGRNSEAFVSSSKGEDRGCSESTMGKGAEECRTETERGQHAEKEDDVPRLLLSNDDRIIYVVV